MRHVEVNLTESGAAAKGVDLTGQASKPGPTFVRPQISGLKI